MSAPPTGRSTVCTASQMLSTIAILSTTSSTTNSTTAAMMNQVCCSSVGDWIHSRRPAMPSTASTP